MQVSVGKASRAAGTARTRALRWEHVWMSGHTAEADSMAGGDERWGEGRSLRPHTWVLSSGWPALAARGRDGVGKPARGGVGSARAAAVETERNGSGILENSE